MFVRLKKEKRLFEMIVDQIKSDVLSGNLKVGDKLPSEHEMATIFGVSRTAVREALRILELSGLVVIKKGNQGGCFIQNTSTGQRLVDYLSDHWRVGNITLDQLTEARCWIEAIIIDIVGKKATKKDFEGLRKTADKAERYYREGKELDKIFQNFNFHSQLAQMAGNPLLADALSAIFELQSYMLVKIKPNLRITQGTFDAHRKMIELIEAGKVDLAKDVNMRHIREVGARLTRKYSKERRLLLASNSKA
ncbi:MAG: FadR/GntR family transcriptional regulator [Thermodesulfobacteriota bacterium]